MAGRWRWSGVAVTLGALGVVVGTTLVGCAPTPAGPATPPPPPPPRAAALTLAPAAGVAGASPRSASVAVAHGRLQQVALTSEDGTPVAGAVSPDGTHWSTTAPLGWDTAYTWSGTAVGEDGRPAPVAGRFATVSPDESVGASLDIADGAVVGVAAPIALRFDGHVADRVAAERALEVTTSVPTEGSWAWLPDDEGGSRVDWRPRSYWRPGTAVTVAVRHFGVPLGGGAWGRRDLAVHFTVGREQVVKADVRSHRMIVVRDGRQVMDLAASYGLGSDPNRNTTNGIHVVMAKDETVLMSNPAYGYTDVPEHWAVRISDNGEFIHANPDTVDEQGSSNVTHGCVNLAPEDAERYFATALYGDPVEVTGSPVPMGSDDGDFYDWTVPWETWRTMSALRT